MERCLVIRHCFIWMSLIGATGEIPEVQAQTTHYLTVANIAENHVSLSEVQAILDRAAEILREGHLSGDWRALVRLKRRPDPCPGEFAPGPQQVADEEICVFTRGGNDTELPSVIHPGDEDLLRSLPSYVNVVKEIWGCDPAKGPGVKYWGCGYSGQRPFMLVTRVTPKLLCLLFAGTLHQADGGTTTCVWGGAERRVIDVEALQHSDIIRLFDGRAGGVSTPYSYLNAMPPMAGPYTLFNWEAVLWAHEFGHTRINTPTYDGHRSDLFATMYPHLFPWNVLLDQDECWAIVKPF